MATNASVEIVYGSSKEPQLQVNPTAAVIEGPGQVTWNVSVPSGYGVEIRFNGGCPFPPTRQPSNPDPGRYMSSGTSVTSQPANGDTNGTWAYTVVLGTDRGTVGTHDGSVVVEKNP